MNFFYQVGCGPINSEDTVHVNNEDTVHVNNAT
jgi:hypothetical protein